MSAQHFEAKKHAYRQTQDGIVISFVVHPSDVNAAIATAPLGTRYMVAFAAIGDDEKPIESDEAPVSNAAQLGSAQTERKKPFSEYPLSQQCAMRCGDKKFREWFWNGNDPGADETAASIRHTIGVKSRSEIATNPFAAEGWRVIESNYQSWLLDNKYADTIR